MDRRMGFPENGLSHRSARREAPLRPRHPNPFAAVRQPRWEAWRADARGRTDDSPRATRTALARGLLAAAVRATVSAVAARVAGPGR